MRIYNVRHVHAASAATAAAAAAAATAEVVSCRIHRFLAASNLLVNGVSTKEKNRLETESIHNDVVKKNRTDKTMIAVYDVYHGIPLGRSRIKYLWSYSRCLRSPVQSKMSVIIKVH